MLILPSVFTEKRLAAIQRTNESLASLREMLVIVKQQRQLLEGFLGRIECASNYKHFQEQFDSLLLKERFLNKSIDQETLKVLIAIDGESGDGV